MPRALFFLLFASLFAPAQTNSNAYAPDIPENGSVEAIAKATGDRRFLSPWVAYVPQSTTVPSPQAFFGRIAGAPGEFVNSEKTF